MESLRVDICYRPLRIGWAIRADDINAFRTAVKYSFALWGGRFNPIIIVDQKELAQELVDLFRVDMIIPVGDSDIVQAFPKQFPYLIKPFFEKDVFMRYGKDHGSSQVLDIHNALVHIRKKPEWGAVKKEGVRIYSWSLDDPLADVFLMQFGDYPKADEVHIDYRAFLKEVAEATEIEISPTTQLSLDIFDHPNISSLSRYRTQRHYSVRNGWDYPGFFSGNAKNLDDLVYCWNLRAADISLLFVDPNHLDRYGETIEHWDKTLRANLARRRYEFDRKVGIWVQLESLDETKMTDALNTVLKPFGKKEFSLCRVGPDSLGGIHPPMMHFAQASTLGVVGNEFDKTKVSFALTDKPFCGDQWFHTQHLVASLSFIGGIYGDEQHMLVPPFIPELNEFYARVQHFEYNKIRSESERIGVVIDAADSSSFIYALPVADLFEQIFELAGFSSSLSEGGLIARQLIAQLGGLNGARAFKIPGVRRLLKTHGPTEAFTKKSALELIGGKDPENPGATFKDYESLYIEPRPHETALSPQAVFTYLVEKGLFRIGAGLKCPQCRMTSWTALDVLKQSVVCELCGHEFDATRQLVEDAWRYRRSGVLGREKNAQGAVPVVLTLQQFQFNMHLLHNGGYSPSLNLTPRDGVGLPFEVDFVWLVSQSYPERTIVVIGECKDRGGKREAGRDEGTLDEKDIENLRRVADALSEKRFETFIVLAKLCPFTANEIALARTLNKEYRHRTILLTSRELEPLCFYERTQLEFENIRAGTPQDLAEATAMMYFNDKKA